MYIYMYAYIQQVENISLIKKDAKCVLVVYNKEEIIILLLVMFGS